MCFLFSQIVSHDTHKNVFAKIIKSLKEISFNKCPTYLPLNIIFSLIFIFSCFVGSDILLFFENKGMFNTAFMGLFPL